jgi:HAMP domain-containing protein
MQLKLSPFKLRNWPLKTQGLVVIFAAQLALVIALLLVILNRSDAALQSSVERTQSEIDLLINTTLADPLLNRDLASLQNIVNEMVRGKLINAIKICSPTGVTLAHSGDISKLAVLPSFSQVKGSQWTETLAIKNTKYVEFSGKKIGKVEYVLSTAEQAQGARDLIFQFFLITGSCIFVTTTLVAISVTRVVSRLRRLVAGTQALANGDSSATIPVNSKDEIGQLTEHFNAMAGAIDQRFVELRDAEREKAIYLSEVSNEQARLSALLESMRVGIVFLDTSGKQLYWNRQLIFKRTGRPNLR